MAKKNYILLILLTIIFSSSRKAAAQTSPNWQVLYLDVAAHTIVDGVEAFSQVNKCKGEDLVYLKLINHNPYPVKIKWFDAVQTPDLKWIKKDNIIEKKSVTVEANTEIKGDCSDNNYSECIIKLKNFIDSQKDFKQYAVYHFQVVPAVK